MTLKTLFKAFINNCVDRYDSVKIVNQKISTDFKDLFQYNANSLDKLIYRSNGVVGLCDDMFDNGRTAFNKLYKIRTSISELENIIFNKSDNLVSDYSSCVIEPEFPSKFKSALISTIVGFGTMSYTYKNLRNISQSNTKENTADTTANKTMENIIYSPEKLSDIIMLKNKYFWKNNFQLQELVQKETGVMLNDIDDVIKTAMNLKINHSTYSNIARINYDSRIASQNMKDDFIRAYSSSDKTLKDLAVDFEKKYGMHISASTISNNARKYLSSQGLDFKNRRETRNYYSNNS